MNIRVGAHVEVAVGPRRGCLAVVERLHLTRRGSNRRYWWLKPLSDDVPLGYYESGELLLVDQSGGELDKQAHVPAQPSDEFGLEEA